MGKLVAGIVVALLAAAAAGVSGAADGDPPPTRPLLTTAIAEQLSWRPLTSLAPGTEPRFEAADADDTSSFCLGDDYVLDSGDGGSTDLLAVQSIGACDGIPGMDVVLTTRQDRSLLGLEILVDTDLDVSTGCDGWDIGVFGTTDSPVAAEWFELTTCDAATWRSGGALPAARASVAGGVALAVTIPMMDGIVAWTAGSVTTDGRYDGTFTFFTPAEVIECVNRGISPDETSDGYWLVTLHGEVHSLGSAPSLGHACEQLGARSVVDVAYQRLLRGPEWAILKADATLHFEDHPPVVFPKPWDVGARQAVAIIPGAFEAATGNLPTFRDWFTVYDNGAVAGRGRPNLGDLRDVELNAPIIDARRTPSGNGYWLIAADGGVFSFGDAEFSGSTGSMQLNEPVIGMAPDPDGDGYWLVATDGGVFAFDSPFVGSIPGVLAPGVQLNRPIVAMEPYGNGYLLLGSDGGVFNFSDRDFAGSLGSNPPDYPVVAIQPLPPG